MKPRLPYLIQSGRKEYTVHLKQPPEPGTELEIDGIWFTVTFLECEGCNGKHPPLYIATPERAYYV